MTEEPSPVLQAALADAARQLANLLAETHTRLVLAASCTGGLVAATLTAIPGVSNWFCGSAVTYRDRTKIQWLGVSTDTLIQHTAVSRETAREMAHGTLHATAEADLALSVTGHLGPEAPAHLDGIVWLGCARRRGNSIEDQSPTRHTLTSQSRAERQCEAACLVLHKAAAMVNGER